MGALIVQPEYIAAGSRRRAEDFFRMDLKRQDAFISANVRVVESCDQLLGMEGEGKTLYIIASSFRGSYDPMMLARYAQIRRFTVKFV